MIFGSHALPGAFVRGLIYASPSASARWYLSQHFGCTGEEHERPYSGCAHFHRGIDIARGPAGCGDDLLAGAGGTVFYAGTLDGGNRAICVRHADGIATGIGHLQGWTVGKGAGVARGQRIALMGKTGNATGCHGHVAMKTGFPANGDVNDFWRDPAEGGKGKWADIEPFLWQNVRTRPTPGAIANLRTAKDLSAASVYAVTDADGHIYRKADDVDLGLVPIWRKWDGVEDGSEYEVAGTKSIRWRRIWLADRWLYIAALLSQQTAA